jgi:hypothetical protein
MHDKQIDGKAESGSHPTRRDFLTRAGLVAGGMALMGVPGFRPQRATAATADSKIQGGGRSALELDGQFMDFLKSAEGGFPKAQVIQEKVGQNLLVKKRIGPPKSRYFDPMQSGGTETALRLDRRHAEYVVRQKNRRNHHYRF